jgi:hypothetical protein
MNSDNREKFKELLKNIGYVDLLSTERLIEMSRKLFELVSFCDCEVDNSYDKTLHKCNRFDHHDYRHSSYCRCCQQRMLMYYLGRCIEKLADNDKLPQFYMAHLSNIRVRDRTYGHIRIGSELIFSIIRHLNAWRDESEMTSIVQNWVFDFANVSLEKLPYGVSTLGVGVSVRRLMELKSEWKGTATELLVVLSKIAGALKIDTKRDQWPNSPWPKSSNKLNQILQELKEYIHKYGITVENQRYVKLSKFRS